MTLYTTVPPLLHSIFLKLEGCGRHRELHSYPKNVGSLPGKSTAQIKDGMKDDQKKGTFQLATCRLTGPNPPPSSFQLNLLFRCLRTAPNIPVLLLFPCETVPLCGRPPGISLEEVGTSPEPTQSLTSREATLKELNPACGAGCTVTPGKSPILGH